MSVLKKIRENVGLVIVIIALSLFAFIFSSVYNKLGPSQDNTIGEVNGSSIDYGALSAKYELAQRNNPTDGDIAKEYQLKEQAWQSLVREIYYNREWKSAGIGISDDELMMMFSGQIYHPYVVQSGYFNDSTGQYSPAMVPLVFQRADEIDLYDPNIQDMWKNWKQGLLDLREIISLDRRSNKWQAAVKGSALVSDNELKWGYEQSSRTADVSYLYVPYASIPDDQAQVSESDRSEYYNKHRESYKRVDDEVRIKYTYFSVAPSRQDSADTRSDLMKLLPEFLSSENAFDFAGTNSDDRTIDTVPKPLGQLPAQLSAINGRTDTVVGPLLTATGYQLMRVVKVTEDSIANVNLNMILIPIGGATAADTLKANAKADSILKLIPSPIDVAKFKEVAGTTTSQPNSIELGWGPENKFGPEAATILKTTATGSIARVNIPNAGIALFHVVERSNKMYSFASITRVVNAGSSTNDSIFKRASMYHGAVVSGGNMDSLMTKYPEARTLVSGNIGPGNYTLMGLSAGRPVVTWAFKSDEGKVCDKLIEADDAFVVAKVEYKGAKGYATVDGLKGNLEFEVAVRNWVKAKQIKGKLGNGGADLAAMASTYGAGATNGSAKGLRMASSDVQGLGPEPKIVGRAFGMKAGETSKPLAGNGGVYVVKLDAIQEPAPMDDMNKMIQRQTLGSSKSEQTVNALFMGMRELADIRDLRYMADF